MDAFDVGTVILSKDMRQNDYSCENRLKKHQYILCTTIAAYIISKRLELDFL